MYTLVAQWLDRILEQTIPPEVAALSFNLYEDGGSNWSIELVGTERFDPEDEDWRCDECFDFGTRAAPLAWREDRAWNEILEELIHILQTYLAHGQHSGILKRYQGIGIGFVDGDCELLFAQS